MHSLSALRRAGRTVASAGMEGIVRLAARPAPTLAGPPREPGSIFVLRNNDIGDLLVVTPLFDALRRRFPDAQIAAGVGDWSRDVLRGNPHLSEVLPANAPWHNKYQDRTGPLARLAYVLYSPEVRAIAERRFEIGIDVLGSAWGALLLLRARIPYRLGVRGYAGGHSAAQATVGFDPREQVGRSALRFAELLGASDLPPVRPQIFLTPEEKESAERWWAAAAGRPRVVIAPGGGLAAKRWPAEHFAAVAAGLPGASILALGGLREEALVAEVLAAAPRTRAFPEPPRLREVFSLVAAADLVVTSSSMALHVAAAFGKRTIVPLGEAFSSAVQHQAQWGYPGLSRSFGKEPGQRASVYTPAEILAAVREEISGSE
ncbi:MAG TPA: glycosyltransferase family 9 protein [Thermoanaerobaculia bacterium]|nr:glycosyltransferase family 9 protein [Thermoanaerobaculia bacterium]